MFENLHIHSNFSYVLSTYETLEAYGLNEYLS